MPIYEYQCTDCHHTFDMLQKINDEPIKKCPQCTKNTVTRLVSAAGFQLKGSGWYATDFKNKGQASPSPGGETPSSTDGSSTETKALDTSAASSVKSQGDSD